MEVLKARCTGNGALSERISSENAGRPVSIAYVRLYGIINGLFIVICLLWATKDVYEP